MKGGGMTYKQYVDYGRKHIHFTAAVHVAVGLGVGLLLYPSLTENAMTWGWVMVIVAVAGHVWPMMAK